MEKKRRLVIIPARGNSKRIKNKNIKKFLGKPIIHFIIDNIKKSKLFDKIHVSTDSKKIKKIVESKGIKIEFMRPKELSDDYTPLIDVFKFIIKKYKNQKITFDEVWAIMPCTPLLNFNDLRKISTFCKKTKLKKPIISMCRYNPPIQWSYKKISKIFFKPLNIKEHKKRSQDLSERFYDSGQFIIYSWKFLNKIDPTKMRNNFFGYVMPYEKSIDIDNKNDWKLAEIIYRGLR